MKYGVSLFICYILCEGGRGIRLNIELSGNLN